MSTENKKRFSVSSGNGPGRPFHLGPGVQGSTESRRRSPSRVFPCHSARRGAAVSPIGHMRKLLPPHPRWTPFL